MKLTLAGSSGDRYLTNSKLGEQSHIPLDETGYEFSAPYLQLEHDFPASTSFLRHGWNSWSASAWWQIDKKPWRVWNNLERTRTAEDAASDTANLHRSYFVTALSQSHECLLIGSLSSHTAVFDLVENRVLGRSLTAIDNINLKIDSLDNNQGKLEVNKSNASVEHSLTHFFIAVGDENTCWQSYIRKLQSVHTVANAQSRKIAPPVWCSWYSYFEEITQEIIRAEIAGAKKLGYRAIQIDDGWEEQVGTWRPNHKFSDGMSALATDIKDQGIMPGLWLSPFIAMQNSEIFQTHPEIFIHDSDGVPLPVGYNWGEAYYGLDCTHPTAQIWLKDLLTTVTGWGYQYLKLDFLYAAAFAGQRYKNIPRESAYRQGIEILRSAAPDAYLLGSGAVIAPSLGVLDGIRVGPDTAPYWDVQERKCDPTAPGLRNALRSTIARAWLRHVIDIDPDVALFRTRGSLLSPDANAISWEAARLGGVFSCSDPYTWLSNDERQAVKRLTHCVPLPAEQIIQLDRYRFQIGEDIVDFEPWINPSSRMSDRILVK